MSDVKVLSWYAPRDLFRSNARKTDKEQCHNDLGRNVRPKKRSSEVNYLDSSNYLSTTSFLHRQKIKKTQTRLTNDSDLSNDSTTRWNSVQKLFLKLQSSFLSLTFQSNRARNPSSFLSSYGTLQHGSIGEGVSASVHLITKGNQVFAVKIFKRRKKRELFNGYMKSLAGEFCISSALNHPNILKTVDFVQMDEDPERYCIVMEYVSFFF
jgi:hypothetical protein